MKLKHHLCDKLYRETVHKTAWHADTHVGLTAGEHAGPAVLQKATDGLVPRRGTSCVVAAHLAKFFVLAHAHLVQVNK